VLGKPQLPDFPTAGSRRQADADGEYFRVASHKGLEVRLAQLYPDEKLRETQRQRYVERLDFEINTILKMGFPGYFLIVADFINWAQNNRCPVGPGRGSGAGSLVAYSLNITGLDRCSKTCCFERFLNPERVSMPDFDIDFCQGNRDRVIDYVKQKYGRDAVSPDRDLRHDGCEGCAARRGARARHGLWPCRLDRQADPRPTRQDRHARQGAGEARPRHHLRAPRSA